MKVKLDDTEYTVQPIPFKMLPMNDYFASLCNQHPKDANEASQIGQKLEDCLDKILGACITPTPKPEHKITLQKIVNKLTTQQQERAEQFFRPEQPNPDKSGTNGAAAP